MATTSANGFELYYERRGTGPRLLFLNGSGGDLRRPPVMFDSPLGAHFDMLAFDYRGLGQSGPADAPYEMSDLADDTAALLDHIGWDHCHVFGVSFGGMVAQELALQYPDRVSKIVAACAPAGGSGGASYPLHTLGHMTPEERARFLIPVLDTRRDDAWQAEHPVFYGSLVHEMSRILRNDDGTPGVAWGLELQLDARSRHDTWDRLSQLKMPIYVCGGRFDASATADSLERMASQIFDVQLEFFDGGHRFWLDDPNAYPHIIEFLDG
jgi:3-oxoadipate enol-lactonase